MVLYDLQMTYFHPYISLVSFGSYKSVEFVIVIISLNKQEN